jgi:hypothetical protein
MPKLVSCHHGGPLIHLERQQRIQVTEKNRNTANWSETLSRSAIGSEESRAAARALLEDPDRLPIIFVESVSPNCDSTGRLIGPPICKVKRATVEIPGAPKREYTRNPEETLKSFKARIVRELPVRYEGRELWADRGGPGLGCMVITLWPPEEQPEVRALPPIDEVSAWPSEPQR